MIDEAQAVDEAPAGDAQPVVGSPPLPETAALGPTRLGTVVAIVGLGLFAQCVGDTLARLGHEAVALPLFFLGLVAIFVPCAWRLTSSEAARDERVRVSLVLGVGLLASYVIRSPLIFDGFDELLHLATLTRMIDTRTLFATNTLLPVSPYYPGLELFTTATKWTTGLPLVLAQLTVLLASRVVLVLAVFLIVERACASSRAGGIGVLVYAASPQFYSFDAQYAYQTLALAFAAGIVYLVLVSVDQPEPQMERPFLLALACIAALVVTHHLTSWLTVGFLVAGAVGLFLLGRRAQARVVGTAAAVGTVVAAAWTALVGRRLLDYLSPIFRAAVSGLASAVGALRGSRQLFHTAAGAADPSWEIVTILAAAVFWCLILLPSAYAAVRQGTVRGGKLRLVPVVIAVGYPFALGTSVSSSSSQVGARATTFIFFGVAVVVGGWLARRLSGHRQPREQMGTVAVAAVCFLGSMMFGSGPDWSYVPGPYLVGAEARSVTPATLAVAEWASTHLVVGSHIAVDIDNGPVLGAIGHLDPITAIGGLVNAGPLFFDRTIGPYDISLIRRAAIRYILIDERLAQGLPLFGTYIEPGETGSSTRPTRLTLKELNKWNSVPGARLIYDNGPIRIYDLASLLQLSPTAPTPGPIDGSDGTGVDWIVLPVALIAAGIWLIRLRRLRRSIRFDEKTVLFWTLAVMVVGLFGAFMIVPTSFSPRLVGLGVLAVLIAIGLRPLGTAAGPAPERAHASAAASSSEVRGARRREGTAARGRVRAPSASSQVALACAGLALVAAGGSSLYVAARKQWTPPAQLSVLYRPSGQAVATVQLGSSGPVASRLEITTGGEVVWSRSMSRTAATQSVVLPRALPLLASRVVLIASGRMLRAVDG